MLSQSIFLLGLFLVSSYAVAAFDTWLHLSSSAISITQLHPLSSSVRAYGKQINETQCAESYTKNQMPLTQSLCELVSDNDDAFGFSAPEGLRTVSNSSDSNQVAYTDDQHAILVPSSLDINPNISYSASTYGVQTSCERCVIATNTQPWD